MSNRSSQKLITRECVMLRHLREKLSLSMRDAARLAGINPATVNHIENGRQAIREEHLLALLPIYGETLASYRNYLAKEQLPLSRERSECLSALNSLPETEVQSLHPLLSLMLKKIEGGVQ